MRGMFLAAGLVAVLPLVAFAQGADCGDLTTQIEMTVCSENAWQAADADLNDAYSQARARMQDYDAGVGGQDADRALRDAQRAWISYRDLACAAEGIVYDGGSIEPMIVYMCLERLTQARTKDLGDLAVTP